MDNNSYHSHYDGDGRTRVPSRRGSTESREQELPWRTGEREPYSPFEGSRRRMDPSLRRGPPERSYHQRGDYYQDMPPSPNRGMDAPMPPSLVSHGSYHAAASRRDFSRRSVYSGHSESSLIRPRMPRGESLPEMPGLPAPRMGIDMPRSESALYSSSSSALPPPRTSFAEDGNDADMSATVGQDHLWLAAQEVNFRESLEKALIHSLDDDPQIEAQIEEQQMREALIKSQETEAEARDRRRVADLENVELALRLSLEDKEHAEELEALEESMRTHAMRLSMTETEARMFMNACGDGSDAWKDKKVKARPTVASIPKLDNHIRPRAHHNMDPDDDWADSKAKSSDRVIDSPEIAEGVGGAEKLDLDQELVLCPEDGARLSSASKVLPDIVPFEQERAWFNGDVHEEEKVEEKVEDDDEELRMALEASLQDIHQGGSFDAFQNTDSEDKKEKVRTKSDSEVEGSTVASTLTIASIYDEPHSRVASLPRDAVKRDKDVISDSECENAEKETEEAIWEKTTRIDSSEHEELDLALALQLSEQDAKLASEETVALPANGINGGTRNAVISTEYTPTMRATTADSRRDLLLRPCFNNFSMTDLTSEQRRRTRPYSQINDHMRYSDGMSRDFSHRSTYDERRQPGNLAHIHRRSQYEVDVEEDRRGLTRRTQSERHMQENLYQGLVRTARALERGEASMIVCRGCAKTLSFPSCEPMVWCPSCATLTAATNLNASLNT